MTISQQCPDVESPFVKLTMKPVPELGFNDALAATEWIHEQYKNQTSQSYGAFVVRHAGVDLAKICMTRFWQLTPSSKIIQLSFKGNSGNGLHFDFGRRNDLTAHLTTKGRAEAIVIPDRVDAPMQLKALGQFRVSDLTQKLFTEDLVPADVPDAMALKTTLEPGDMLLFDHTRYHAFQALTDDRLSEAYFTNVTAA